MARYIDADALEVRFGWLRKSNDFRKQCGYTYIPYVLSSDIFSAPTADVAPVKHGQWLETDAFPHRVYCSECFKTIVYNRECSIWADGTLPRNYCPNCGAKMDGGEEE